MDLIKHKVLLEGKEIDLTAKEYALLSFLASNPDVFSARNNS